MFKNMFQRSLTFFVVAPFVFLFIWYDQPPYGIILFVALMAAVGVLGTNEFFTITSKTKGNSYEMIGYTVVLAMILSSYMIETEPLWNSRLGLTLSLLVMGFFSWELLRKKIIAPDNQLALVARAIFYLGWFLSYIVLIRNLKFGYAYIIYLALTIMACDTMAYFIGNKFGKHKVAPAISPKKSVEGCVAGLFFAIIASILLGGHYLGLKHTIIMGIIIGLFGQLGDFFESMLKRQYNAKDSGWLLPGHGGILDRMDSALYCAPLIYYYIIIVVHHGM